MRNKRGFTLIEILIVVTILAILATIAGFGLTSNLGKTRDSKRKADLSRLKTAFEEYYSDQNAYPPDDVLLECDGTALRPYLSSIPCDPKTDKPYCYIYDLDNDGQNYKILSSLENIHDPAISTLDCDDDPDFCGYEEDCTQLGLGSKFDYGVTSSNVIVNREVIGGGTIITSPSPSSQSSPTPIPSAPPGSGSGSWSCTPQGGCNNYAQELFIAKNCVFAFSSGTIDSPCVAYCAQPNSARCDP